jgi:hypothetical protein
LGGEADSYRPPPVSRFGPGFPVARVVALVVPASRAVHPGIDVEGTSLDALTKPVMRGGLTLGARFGVVALVQVHAFGLDAAPISSGHVATFLVR